MSENETVDLVVQAIKAIRKEQVKVVGFSWLQRKLRICYPRAARLVDELVAEGVLSTEHIDKSFERRVIGEDEIKCESHLWEKDYYGDKCIKCGLLVPDGCGPWMPVEE